MEQKGEDYWAIYSSESVATVLTLKGKSTYKQVGNTEITDEIKEGYEEAVANDANTFEVDGTTYTIEKAGRENQITISGEVAFATKKVFSAATNDAEMGFVSSRQHLMQLKQEMLFLNTMAQPMS